MTDAAAAPLAIVAGKGALPWEAAALVARRRPVLVLAVDGEADPGPPDIPTHRVGYGQVGKALKILRAHDCGEVLFLGAIRARPDFRRILGDVETLKLVPKILRAVVGGDDTVVRNVLALVESEGLRIAGVTDAVPELMVAPGTIGRNEPDAQHEADIAFGTAFLDAASPFDIGQAVAVAESRIVAVEGAEGTDAMIARCAEVVAAKRVRPRPGGLVLVKRAKRRQDMRADVPVVGAETVANAHRAGFGGIALEAGRTIVAERALTAAAVDRAGLFMVAR